MPHPPSIAIVGIGGIFPDAPDIGRFWDIIRNGQSTVRDVPAGRWHLSPDAAYDPETAKADHVYSRKGCFIDQLPVVPALTGLDPLFHLLAAAGRLAFEDAVTEPLDRSRTGVIIGNLALPSESSAGLARQWLGSTFEEALTCSSSTTAAVPGLNRYVAGLPAGILAETLGLGGGHCTLDAACASSLYAIKLAVDELLSGRADAMLTGGVSRPDPLYTQMGFSQLRALSKRGIAAPLDASGDGLLVGEGAGLFLLKRLDDALAHGDRIYGVIRGIGLSNDLGGSLLAPSSEGQVRAMSAAYRQAGWQPDDVDLIECHATGTPVGDAVEVASLRELWQGIPSRQERCVIGSVKSNIGHLLTAAGAAALTKVLLAMQHQTLPPTANFNRPQPGMELDNSPFTVLTACTPWHRRGDGIPRRAAVSAFGFGGINAHLLVEEWLGPAPLTGHQFPGKTEEKSTEPVAIVGMDASFGPWQGLAAVQERLLGGRNTDQPAPPQKWWNAEASRWFKEQGLDRTPFNGFYLNSLEVAAARFRIPPKELEEMLPQQLLMLTTAAGALADAGIGREGNQRGGVFVGIALDLNSTNFSFRWSLAQQAARWAKEAGGELAPEALEEWTAHLRDAAGPPLTANRTMGALGNIVASRIAREFRFGGPGFTLSSEESSGIRALETAVRQLRQGEIDRALVGAVDLAGDLRAVLGHHETRELSRSGRSVPFDREADGSLVGEGAAAVVLKRLSDAQRDGDRIYAVIRGIGSSGGTTVVPGQPAYTRAVQRACADSGIDLSTVSYLEAHGSGHPAEDRMEAAALADCYGVLHEPRSCAVSSISGLIGHTGAASGLASLLRCCLALRQEIIPPCGEPSAPLEQFSGASPLYLATTPRYWLRNRADGPRRAGVGVFGVDGSCHHVLLEEWEANADVQEPLLAVPLGIPAEALFVLAGKNRQELVANIGQLRHEAAAVPDNGLAALARRRYRQATATAAKPLTLTLVARNREELLALLELGLRRVQSEEGAALPVVPPALRDRLFFTPTPLGRHGKVAFVFPGSGNHFSGMAMELSARWPALFRRQDRANRYLRSQFHPELFWNGADRAEIDTSHQALIFGQVATGCAVADLVQTFGIRPHAAIGYSLGETASLFALKAWQDRDGMLARMQASTLFTRDLAGECRAARQTWGMRDNETVDWSIGVLAAPATRVRQILHEMQSGCSLPLAPGPLPLPFRVYLLIVNTPEECVIGGDAAGVRAVVEASGAHFFPLQGVTTVHCDVAQAVSGEYRALHLFDTRPPAGVTFYSAAKGASYGLDRESAADAIVSQSVQEIDFPRLIESAWQDGVRLFLEMGPGNSCSRMIGRILGDRPHLAAAACYPGADQVSALLRFLAALLAEGLPVDLSPLYPPAETASADAAVGPAVRLTMGGSRFNPPRLPQPAPPAAPRPAPSPVTAATNRDTAQDLLQEFAQAQSAAMSAHEAFLNLSSTITQSMAQAMSLEMSLRQALGDEAPLDDLGNRALHNRHTLKAEDTVCAYNRSMCMEFAIGKVSRMLGPQFAEVDRFPTRVRLPDEPLMLVDRIVSVEGEPCSMTSGRVVTEHDILPDAWYLDGGRIPTCIAVEAGQADLFLSGYLGIDFITRGLAVYRLLDAVVTFHRSLPGPGETINYDIRIERFFRQGDTWLFRFFFEATVNGEPLLSMRDGCAGFFSAAALEAGKGIVRPAIDLRPTSGIRQPGWQELLPLAAERYDAAQLDRLRAGDLAGCFGPLFAGLPVKRPLTIPGGRMRLVHRVNEIIPDGGRYGLGQIRAEADIFPTDWFITCHFVDDRVMPGTLMYECCMHTLRILLLRMGWVAEADSAVWEPVPGVASKLCCRGQVLETTKIVTYEVAIREIGYRPEPYVVADALMYADGKPIVEISSMSCRLSGTTGEQLQNIWKHAGATPAAPYIKPAIYTKEQILAYSNGKPSEGFGEPYRIFDKERKIARLPGPPFQFMDRVTAVRGEPWQMQAGAMAEAQYDLPVDAWFFAADRQPRMPFCVLLEAALQPCGWLAAYVGSALTSPTDISFRNLGGTAIQHRPVTPENGTLTCSATMTKVATSGGMIIQEFDFTVADSKGLIYEGETMFGFFSKEALANQVGIRDAKPYQPGETEIARGRSLPYPADAPFPDTQLRMIDRIELFVPDGGPAGLGFIRGSKQVNPDEWFFKAHFFEDPVTPGSLGLESFQQLLKFTAIERWGLQEGAMFASVALSQKHRWLYRGQVVPANRQVIVEAWITAADDQQRLITASGFLAVDGKLIYQMIDFTLQMELS